MALIDRLEEILLGETAVLDPSDARSLAEVLVINLGLKDTTPTGPRDADRSEAE